MSKANEWVEVKRAAATAPEWELSAPDMFLRASVRESVHGPVMVVESQIDGSTVSPADALHLAHWIIDTFGEPRA